MNKRSLILAGCALLAILAARSHAMEGFIGLTNGYFYNKSTGEPWVPHGIAYQTWNRPLGVWQTREQIEYDLDEMVKMGANSVRIDMVWQHVEEDADNVFKWDNYDFFVQACEDRNLRIFALIGYQWPPNWFPDAWYTQHPPSTDSEGIKHSERWQSDIINYEHPQARAQYAEWLGAVAGHFKDSKAIVGWIVGNESGYLGLWSGLLDGYDPETEAAFQTWAGNKYSTIAAANAKWGSSYASFNDVKLVEQYRAYGVEGAIWADMVQFREDSIAGFTAVGAAGAKAADTNHLISYSTVGMQWGEEDWRYHAEDRGKITAVCLASNAPIDFFSVNNYPWSILGHESQNGHWGISYTKKVAGVPVLYSETGFTSSETMWTGMDEYRQGPLVRNALWESLEAGAIGTHIFSWMDRPYITDREKGFGILYADRRIKPAFWESRLAYNLMDQVNIHGLLMGSEDPTPNIAFLWTSANDSQYNRYECEMQQVAGALERLGFEPNFMNLEDLANHQHTNYLAVFLPRNMRVEDTVPGTSLSILDFLRTVVIADGVHVIACADLPGMQDANGNFRAAFQSEVSALFGVNAEDIGGYEVPARGGEYVSWYWEPLNIQFTGNAVGALANGYTYGPRVWKYSDETEVSDGTLWAEMDSQRNKGFENSASELVKWDGHWGNTEIRSDWGWAYDGTNMVQMWNNSGMWNDTPVVPWGRYNAGAYFRANPDDPLRGGQYAVVELEWYDKDNNKLSTSESKHLAGSFDWQKVRCQDVAPADSWTMRRIIRCGWRDSQNLLNNPGLTGTGEIPDGWNGWNTQDHTADSGTYYLSAPSWKFWWNSGIWQDVEDGIGSGDAILFGGYVYHPSGDALRNGDKLGYITLEFRDARGTVLGTTQAGMINQSSVKSHWIPLLGRVTVPNGTVSTRIVAGCWASSGEGAFFVDNLFVMNESIFQNLVGNPGLTGTGESPDGWQEWWNGSHGPYTAESLRGGSCWNFWWQGGIWHDMTNGFVAGDTVEFGGFLRHNSSDPLAGGDKYGAIKVEFYNGNTFLSYAESSPINASSEQDAWLPRVNSVTVPANATRIRMIIFCGGTSGSGSFRADDVFVHVITPAGSVYVDNKQKNPAVVVKDHGTAKAAIFMYTVGDTLVDGDGDGEMDVLPWQWRYDIFDSLLCDYFGMKPYVKISGPDEYLCLAEHRTCSDGSTLWQIKNYQYDTNDLTQSFTISSDLFSNRTVKALYGGKILEENSDGSITLDFPGDGMEMLHVYPTVANDYVIRLEDVPALVRPFGDKAFQVSVRYDCRSVQDLTLKLAFCEKTDNGDGTSNEMYQVVEGAVTGSGLYTNYLWIPDPDTEDTDYISTVDGGEYVFRAWLEDGNGVKVAEAIPQDVQLKWGVNPVSEFPEVIQKGDSVNVSVEWEDLNEYLGWENTPLARADAFPDRVAIFRSSKTEKMLGGQFDRVNAVCDWLESMGYENGEKLDISFDNLAVEGEYLENFADGVADGISRDAGCANWTVEAGALRAWRIGNDDNICSFGNSEWVDYTASVDIRYNKQGNYFNDAELYVRYQDRNNYVKVGIRNYYGFWRLKYTVRSETNFVNQDWIHYFTKANRPVEGQWYNLKVKAEGIKYTVYFTDANGEQEVGTFYDDHFLTGKVAVGSKASQLGIWDPQKGYYFVDDDEYSFYSAAEGAIVTLGKPLNLDWGYLNTFYPTLILPGTFVMSDIEVENVIHWFTNSLHCLIATDGGVAMLDEYGSNGLGRIESVFGMNGAVTVLTNLQQLTVGGADHYVTLDYPENSTVTLTGEARAWTSTGTGIPLADVHNGLVSVPSMIVNVNTNDPLSPKKAVCFNFGVDTQGQLTNQAATLAKRAFEWARGEAYKVRLELKCQVNPNNADQDLTVSFVEGWLLSSSGTNTLVLDIPEENVITGSNMYWAMYIYPWDSTNAWVSHGGFYTSVNDCEEEGVFTDLAGAGLQMLGVTDTAYAGRDWDMWVAYNTRGQDMVITYGLKDKGDLDIADTFDDGSLTGWTVYPSGNTRWTEANGQLQAAAPAAPGYTWVLRNGLDISDRNITVEYDVLFDAATSQGGFVYRGHTLNLNPSGIWWTTNAPVPPTNSGTISIYIGPDGLSTGVWHHIAVSIREGEEAPASDVYVDGEPQYVNVPLLGTNFSHTSVGFLSTYSNGVMNVKNFHAVDELYSMASTTVNGFHVPTNAAEPTFWATAPDYDQNKWEYEGTALGGTQEFYAFVRGTNLSAAQETALYFGARLMVENAAFPTNMDKGETVSVPVEWENLPEETMRLHVALVYPYQTIYQDAGEYGSADYTIHGTSSNGWFEITVPNSTPAGSFYLWTAYVYPTNAANAYAERVSLDDTFHFGTNGPSIIWYPREQIISVSSTVAETDELEVYTDAGTPENTEVLVWGADYYATVTSSSLNDGGFEASTGNGTFPNSGYWLPSSSGGGSYAICTTTAARSATNGLWAYTGSDSWANWVSPYQDYYAVEGDLYRVQAYIRQPTGQWGTWVSGAQAYVRMKFLNALSNEISHVDSAVKVTAEDQDWTLCAITNAGVAPVGTAYMRIELFVDRPSTTTGVAVATFDDLYVGMGNSFYGNYTGEGEDTPEGTKCFRSSVVHWSGWGVFFSTNTYPQGANLSEYTGGYLKFWLKTPGYTRVELKDINGTVQGYPSNVTWMNPTTNALGQVVWQEKTIPLSHFSNIDFTHVVSPFMGTDPIEHEAFEFLIDDVRWTLEE